VNQAEVQAGALGDVEQRVLAVREVQDPEHGQLEAAGVGTVQDGFCGAGRGRDSGVEVETRYGEGLKKSVVNEAGDFIFIPPDVPHQPVNLSATWGDAALRLPAIHLAFGPDQARHLPRPRRYAHPSLTVADRQFSLLRNLTFLCCVNDAGAGGADGIDFGVGSGVMVSVDGVFIVQKDDTRFIY